MNVLSNPSRALMNIHLWKDELIDNDRVLIMENDSVFCSTEDILHDVLAQWESYAYLGAPWPIPSQDTCHDMSKQWHVWVQNDLKGENISSEQHKQRRNKNSLPNGKDMQQLESQFPDLCESGKGPGPVGRGGLSLRSREWMIRAIETCPHLLYSGIDVTSQKHAACHVKDTAIDEGFYFSVVLRGLRAPLPHAVPASLFAFESVWPEDAAQAYGDPDQHVSSGGNHHLYSHPVIHWKKRRVTVSYGVHKAWDYFPESLLDSEDMNDACPFLKCVWTKR
jgi:hypothetical protein